MDHSKLNTTELKGLKTLRGRIRSAGIPPSSLDETINIATWNVRHWGDKRRMRCSLHYIAEILHQFDLVAITELKRNVRELYYVLELLGPYWDAVFSDYTTDAGGNDERIAFVFDKRAVQPTGLAAESDGPRHKDKETGQYVPDFNWWRKPYLASFKAGSFDFVMLAVHLQWGTTAGRTAELEQLAEWVNTFQKDEFRVDRDVIAIGDFNITSYRSKLYKAVTKHGLAAPSALLKAEHGSNLQKNKRYDQILHHPTVTGSVFSKHGGVVDFYKSSHRSIAPYKNMSKPDFTHQLSDHLPLWVQLNVDVEDEQLDQLLARRTRP